MNVLGDRTPTASTVADLDTSGTPVETALRRAFLVLVSGLVVAAAGGAFGHDAGDTGRDGTGQLSITAPTRVRVGRFFQVRIDVAPRRDLRNAAVVLDSGWFDGFTVNAIEPQPADEAPEAGGVALTYGPVSPSRPLVVWLSFQTEPNGFGSRRQRLILRDGPRIHARMERTVRVFG